MTETPLDMAHARMEAAPESDAARLSYFARLAESELFLMLAAEPEGDNVMPELFDLGDVRFALVFDREDRLSAFAAREVPYAALSGRVVATLLAEQGIGLAVNLESVSQNLLPPEAVDWLAATLGQEPAEAEARPTEFHPPRALPEALLVALDAKLALAQGLARRAYLVEALYDNGVRGHLLAITGAVPGAEPALARAVNEALVFSGLEAGALDVTFLRDSDPAAASIARAGLRFDLPEPETPQEVQRIAPGSDPSKPPILR